MMVDATRKLPAEVLAACFAFLKFEDLISVSHVSLFWRSSSLAFPCLWSHISLSGPFGQPANLLHMAISRAGQLAVHFDYFQYMGGAPQSMIDAVAQYMHRFKRFEWNADLFELDLRRPAPLLRDFGVCDDRMWIVPKEFLGGSLRDLRTVHLGAASFPNTCPAFETVTHLSVSYPEFADESPRFDRLFDLFPRLEILHLRDIDGSPGVELPAGPAPRTLREVKLESWSSSDLVDLCTLWELGSVADVQLTMTPDPSSNIAAFISGVEDLSFLVRGVEETHVIARMSNGYQRRLICDGGGGDWEPVSGMADVLRDPAALTHVQALEVPLDVLNHAIITADHWPRLAQLTVHIWALTTRETYLFGAYYPRFCWSALDCLRAMPALEALALHVRTKDGSPPPTSSDERGLVERLSTLCGCLPPEVLIYGFTGYIARILALQDDDRHHLVFLPTY